jgi:hypothetical protein
VAEDWTDGLDVMMLAGGKTEILHLGPSLGRGSGRRIIVSINRLGTFNWLKLSLLTIIQSVLIN